MEAELVPSLTTLIQDADQWREVLLLLPLLVALEAVLSADNAIALAAISRRLHDPDRQRQALNIGLLLALVLRLGLIVAARWVLHAWPLQLLASGYLLWLCGDHLVGLLRQSSEDEDGDDEQGKDSSLVGASLLSVVATLAFTDLAFSLDSVAATVAVTAGASAPEDLVQGVISRISEAFAVTVEEVGAARETVSFKLPRALLA